MGWAGSAYQYGILAAHWYWIGAIPAMLFLGMVMMPFYYVCKTHSVPGYLKLRYGGQARASWPPSRSPSWTDSDERREHVRHGSGHEGGSRLGSELLHHRGLAGRRCVYVALGGLRSAIFNEVLQFVLIWGGALLVPILGLD